MDNKLTIRRKIMLVIGLMIGLIIVIIISTTNLFASGQDSIKTYRVGQVTFIYPLGTNGVRAMKYANGFSLNILAGISGGTNGFEAAGLVNIDIGKVRGFQGGGIANIVQGPVNGFQCAGLVNQVRGEYKGFQTAGLVNVDQNKMTGFQGAGLVNVTLKDSRGVNAAGIANINQGKVKGAQLGGNVNVTLQDHEGIQAAGEVNFTGGNFKGLQVAGIANVAIKEVRGVQAGGIVNYAGNLNGVQIGFINYADTVSSGLPLGFISVVRHGYRRFEIEFNETLYGNLTFKTGTNRLYNIFSVGYRVKDDQMVWGVTYGLGTILPVNQKFSFNVDLTSTHLNENEAWTRSVNSLNRLKVNGLLLLGKRIELFAGASLNVMVSRLTDSEGRPTGSVLTPSFGFYESTIHRTHVTIYPGFNAGIRF